MKKIISLLLMIIVMSSISYAYSEDFKYMLDTLEISEKNTSGLLINEEIYNAYNLLVYGSPLKIKEGQRWKDVKEGRWTYNGGVFKNNIKARRGEYWILGENADGKEVHNEIFPDDYVTGTSPLDWNYIEIADAEESWLDNSSYHSEKQKEYMLKHNLSRYGETYEINVEKIGMKKARLENYATWKTSGSIYTKKIGQDNRIWVATFNIPPMAANAKLKSNLKFGKGNNFKLKPDEEVLEIPISFGAIIEEMSEYVTKEDIKNIKSELYIDGKRVSSISKNEEISINQNYILNFKKDNYSSDGTVEIAVKCNSIAETYFNLDTPMYSSCEEVIVIHLDEEKQNVFVESVNKRFESGDKPKIASIEIKRITTDSKGNEKYVDLPKALKTNKEFILAGQVIHVKVTTLNNTESVTLEFAGDKSMITLDDLTEKFEWTEPKMRGVKTRYKRLQALKKSYNMPIKLLTEDGFENGKRTFTCIYIVPYGTKQTLESWASLREKNRNAFSIDESKVFDRIDKPYILVVKAKSKIGIVTKEKELDVFEAWNTVYNRDLTKYVK